MKKIIFSEHALLKVEILKQHNIAVDKDFIKNTIIYPDKTDYGYKDRPVAQKRLDNEHVLRSFMKNILIIY